MSKASIWLIPIIFLLAISVSFANTVTLYPSDDAYVDSANPTTNYGSSGEIWATGFSTTPYNYRGYFKYDFSSCDGINASDVLDVTAYFYTKNVSGTLQVFHKLSIFSYGWNEITINYNNKPSVTNYTINNGYFGYLDFHIGSDGSEQTMNVTTSFMDEITASTDTLTFGWNGGGALAIYIDKFYSKEAYNPMFRPRMVITYNGTLTCNETGSNTSSIQEVHLPSYVRPYSTLPCYVKDSVDEAVTWKIYKKELADVGFNLTYIGTGTTKAGEWKQIGQANASIVSPDALFKCVVNNDYATVISNNANITHIFNISYVSDVSVYHGGNVLYFNENHIDDVVFHNDGSQSHYALVGCDLVSPSNTHYYPKTSYGYSECFSVANGYTNETEKLIALDMTENGAWERVSCTVYASAYSDCPAYDLGEQDYSLTTANWYVSGLPSIEDIYITPSSPLTNQSVNCFAKANSGDNETSLDEVWIQFDVDILGGLGSVKFTNVTNGTYVNASFNIKNYAVEGSNVSCCAYANQRTPVYVSGIASCSDNVTAIVLTGSEIGRYVGGLFGMNGELGNMMVAILVSIVAMVLAVIGIASFTDNPMALGIVAIAVLISGIGIFTVAGYLPIWIILIIIILCASIITAMMKSSISGGS